MDDAFKRGVISGVAEVIADPKITPKEMHHRWLMSKEEDGWKYGETIDYEEKLHPNMVKFKKLSKVEQGKDQLFIDTVLEELKK